SSFCFFFASRRRHTRFSRDWSSDVCSSDLEEKLLGWDGIESVYTRVGRTRGGGQDIDEDVVGIIQYEFLDWRERKSANEILNEQIGRASCRERVENKVYGGR